MNVEQLNKSIEMLRRDLGDGLISTDIWSVNDSLSIAGYNSKPEGCAIKNRITSTIIDSYKEIKHVELGRFYILDLSDSTIEVVIPLGKFQWGILINPSKVKLGLLLNFIIPKVIDSFEQAMML